MKSIAILVEQERFNQLRPVMGKFRPHLAHLRRRFLARPRRLTEVQPPSCCKIVAHPALLGKCFDSQCWRCLSDGDCDRAGRPHSAILLTPLPRQAETATGVPAARACRGACRRAGTPVMGALARRAAETINTATPMPGLFCAVPAFSDSTLFHAVSARSDATALAFPITTQAGGPPFG